MRALFAVVLAVFSGSAVAHDDDDDPALDAALAVDGGMTAPDGEGEQGTFDEWYVVKHLGPRLTSSGAQTTDRCGYTRAVKVKRRSPPTETEASISVGCVSGSDGLPAPDKPTLKLPPEHADTPLRIDDGSVEVTVVGGLFASEARTALRRGALPSIQKCHEQAAGPAGTLGLNLDLSSSGRIVGVVAYDATFGDTDALTLCLKEAVNKATFPSPRDGAAKVSVLIALRQKRAAEGAPLPRACKSGELPAFKDGAQTCIVRRPCAHDELPKAQKDLPPGEGPCIIEYVDRGVAFLKGELTNFGDVQLVNARNSIGVGVGVNVLDNVVYAVARPDVNLKFGPFSLGLGAPLRFEVADLNAIDVTAPDPVAPVFANAGRFRLEDWDQVEDFLRPLRYATWGRKEDHLYVDVNRVHSLTLGHGQLVRRYAPNLDIDQDKIFAQVDGYGDYGGVEVMAGPFPVPRVAGALVFIKPFGVIDGLSSMGEEKKDGEEKTSEEPSYASMVLRSLSLGFTYVTDLNTPTGLDARNNPVDGRRQLVVDQTGQFSWSNRRNIIGDVVQGIGFDAEAKVLKQGPFDIKVYGDYSHLFFPGDTSPELAFAPFNGGGASVGGLLRVSFGTTPIRNIDDEDEATKKGLKPREMKAAHAMRARLEARTFAPTYLPSYWNTMYEVDRFQFGFNDNRIVLPTKIRYLADQAPDPWRVGYYSEFSYEWVDALGVTAMFEDAYPLGGNEPVRGKNLALHVESKGLGFLQVFATYHFRNFEFDELPRAFSFSSDNEIVFFGGRLQVLPIMFINVGAQRAFRTGFSNDDVLRPNDKGERFSSIGMRNTWAYGADVEFGWQF